MLDAVLEVLPESRPSPTPTSAAARAGSPCSAARTSASPRCSTSSPARSASSSTTSPAPPATRSTSSSSSAARPGASSTRPASAAACTRPAAPTSTPRCAPRPRSRRPRSRSSSSTPSSPSPSRTSASSSTVIDAGRALVRRLQQVGPARRGAPPLPRARDRARARPGAVGAARQHLGQDRPPHREARAGARDGARVVGHPRPDRPAQRVPRRDRRRPPAPGARRQAAAHPVRARRPRPARRGSCSSPPASSRPATAASSSAGCARSSASRAPRSRSPCGCARSASAGSRRHGIPISSGGMPCAKVSFAPAVLLRLDFAWASHGLWRSLVAHLTGGQGVAGSNPVSPTNGVRLVHTLRAPFSAGGGLVHADPIPSTGTGAPGFVCSRGRCFGTIPRGVTTQERDVAQLGSALDWGSRGRRFKSCHPDVQGLLRQAGPFSFPVDPGVYSAGPPPTPVRAGVATEPAGEVGGAVPGSGLGRGGAPTVAAHPLVDRGRPRRRAGTPTAVPCDVPTDDPVVAASPQRGAGQPPLVAPEQPRDTPVRPECTSIVEPGERQARRWRAGTNGRERRRRKRSRSSVTSGISRPAGRPSAGPLPGVARTQSPSRRGFHQTGDHPTRSRLLPPLQGAGPPSGPAMPGPPPRRARRWPDAGPRRGGGGGQGVLRRPPVRCVDGRGGGQHDNDGHRRRRTCEARSLLLREDVALRRARAVCSCRRRRYGPEIPYTGNADAHGLWSSSRVTTTRRRSGRSSAANGSAARASRR